MTQLGVPVPAGFTITTEACRAYMRAGKQVPDGLEDEIERHVQALEEKAGKRFGDTRDPLLVSVRSGAAVSMPGMMDTILNLGLGDDAVEGLAETRATGASPTTRTGGSSRCTARSWTGSTATASSKSCRGSSRSAAPTRTRICPRTTSPALTDNFKRIYQEATGRPFSQDAREQLRRAVQAVFDSWDIPRAQVYRRAHDIPDDLGTAVNVVQMVFGNKGDSSGTGVAFTRDPGNRRAGHLRRVPLQCTGRGRRRRHPHARPDLDDEGEAAPGVRAVPSTRPAGSRSTTATCRTSSSRSRKASSTSCRPEPGSGRPRPR